MSYTTDILIYVDYDGDKGLVPFLEHMSNIERFGDVARRIDTENAGGTRLFTAALYALGSNYFPTDEIQKCLDAVRWTSPDNVVVICTTEDRPTEVLRPTYTTEPARWGEERGRVTQP